ncbi:MAG: right-handed parallel beta-helix repeat-containing protein [Sedimentisphaerales bacterium]|nr:right-handed parallel beta-helix repeat-containing protein [Sedimentisphaerales bacterium]
MRLLPIYILLLLSTVCLAEVLNVPSGPYTSIQQAIDAAGAGDEIVVAPGRYFENIDFVGKAITVRSTDPNDPNITAVTIIDGNRPGDVNFASVVTFQSGEDANSIIEGFTITGGTGSWVSVYWEFKGYLWNLCGGGIICLNSSSPTIRKNIITNNLAGQGGGVYCYEYSDATIIDNTISDNNAVKDHGFADPDPNDPNVYDHGDGGAIVGFQYCDLTIKNNIIQNNHADYYGGAIHIRQWSGGLVENNLIAQNDSSLGAGIHITYTSAPVIRKNNIIANTAGPFGGGGIYLYYHSDALIEQNLITQNYCINGAGIAVYWQSSPIIRNNLITKNLGGEVIRIVSQTPVITNNTISFNEAGGIEYTVDATPVITNNIITSNGSGKGIIAETMAGTVTYNNIWGHSSGNYSAIIGNLTGISGNISADPGFIEPDANDYHLNYLSPCINTGDPNTVTADINDFDGNPRRMGQFADIGALETKPVWNISTDDKYDDIQTAINDANNGQTIVLTGGTHRGSGNKNIDFDGKAVIVQSSNPDDPAVIRSTIIDCENNGRAFWFHNGEGADSIIRGISIINGGSVFQGGAILCSNSSPTVERCILENNQSADNGGAVYCISDSNAAIVNCLLLSNSAGNHGGGLYAISSSPAIVNCSIIGNKALLGGGVVSYNQSNPSIANCIITNNLAPDGNQLALVSTLRTEPSEEITEMVVKNSNIEGGQAGVLADANMVLHWESGNINADANFVDPGSWNDANTPADVNDDYYVTGNYHLLPGSICIDKGDNNSVDGLFMDIDSESRIFDGTVDMGADEFVSNLADFNQDGIVDFKDIYVYSENWLQTASGLPADFVDDDFINFEDLVIFADNWLWRAGWYR